MVYMILNTMLVVDGMVRIMVLILVLGMMIGPIDAMATQLIRVRARESERKRERGTCCSGGRVANDIEKVIHIIRINHLNRLHTCVPSCIVSSSLPTLPVYLPSC